jgi:hypothetical protein
MSFAKPADGYMKLLIMLLCLYCSVCHAFDDDFDVPATLVDPQGNVVNYADLYRGNEGHVAIRYYLDGSINRLAVEDSQGHSYALNGIIEGQLEEALHRWSDAAGHRFSIAPVHASDAANLVVYGVRDPGQPSRLAVAVPAGYPTPAGYPRAGNAAAIYINQDAFQTSLNIFLDPNNPFSRDFRTYTGVTTPSYFLVYLAYLNLLHEEGHVFALTHPDSPSPLPAGYTERPIVGDLPASITPAVPVMLANGYLARRYEELGHEVHIDDITPAPQERWLMQLLWTHRNQNLHCEPSSPSTRSLRPSTQPADRPCLPLLPGQAWAAIPLLLLEG